MLKQGCKLENSGANMETEDIDVPRAWTNRGEAHAIYKEAYPQIANYRSNEATLRQQYHHHSYHYPSMSSSAPREVVRQVDASSGHPITYIMV